MTIIRLNWLTSLIALFIVIFLVGFAITLLPFFILLVVVFFLINKLAGALFPDEKKKDDSGVITVEDFKVK